ncbi:MAG: methionine--tRNA ligase, partial [Malacoplasma sp.]|nr:methionine--tRNA ligase [Malacoplasma sp.]
RTSSQEHVEVIQKVFEKLFETGNVYLGKWTGLYCVQCEENYSPKDVIEKDGKLYCKVGHEITKKEEETYFLKLTKFQKWIEEFYKDRPNFIYPQERVKELLNNFIKPGIEDLSITRTTFSWGAPTLSNPKHILYVWIDALMSYLSGLGYLKADDHLFQEFWQNNDVERVHIIGKEITRFHGIYWPIMLHCLNLNQPSRLVSHGWIVTKEGKMSKSLGNVVDPFKIVEERGADFLRYFLLKTIKIENDGIYSEDLTIELFNNDLANNYGNFISRSLGMINKYAMGIIPNGKDIHTNINAQNLINEASKLINDMPELVHNFDFVTLLTRIMNLCSNGNKYIEETKPWELVKQNRSDEVNNFLNVVANIAKILTFLLSPVLKLGTKQACEQYNIDLSKLNLETLLDFSQLADHKVNTSKPIFLRITDKK